MRKLQREAQNPLGGSIGDFFRLLQTNQEDKRQTFLQNLPIQRVSREPKSSEAILPPSQTRQNCLQVHRQQPKHKKGYQNVFFIRIQEQENPEDGPKKKTGKEGQPRTASSVSNRTGEVGPSLVTDRLCCWQELGGGQESFGDKWCRRRWRIGWWWAAWVCSYQKLSSEHPKNLQLNPLVEWR